MAKGNIGGANLRRRPRGSRKHRLRAVSVQRRVVHSRPCWDTVSAIGDFAVAIFSRICESFFSVATAANCRDNAAPPRAFFSAAEAPEKSAVVKNGRIVVSSAA